MFEKKIQRGTWIKEAEQIDQRLHLLDSLLNTGTDIMVVIEQAEKVMTNLENLANMIELMEANSSLDEGDKKERWNTVLCLCDSFKELRKQIIKKINQQLAIFRGNPAIGELPQLSKNSTLQSGVKNVKAFRHFYDIAKQQREYMSEITVNLKRVISKNTHKYRPDLNDGLDWISFVKPSLMTKIGTGLIGVFVFGILFFV